MVVSLSGAFVQGSDRWMIDPFQPAGFDERIQIAIDRRLVERSHEVATVRQNLVHAQRLFMPFENLFDGHSLRRIAFQCLLFRFFVIASPNYYCKCLRNKLDKGRFAN